MLSSGAKEFRDCLKIKFNMQETKIQENWESMKDRIKSYVKKELQEFAGNFLELYICKAFDQKFHNTNGRLELWKTASTEYLTKKYESTLEDCKAIILLFETFEFVDSVGNSEKDKKKDTSNNSSFMVVQQNPESAIQILSPIQIEKYKNELIHHADAEREKALRECKSKGILENLFYEVIPTFVEDKWSKLKK